MYAKRKIWPQEREEATLRHCRVHAENRVSGDEVPVVKGVRIDTQGVAEIAAR